MRIFDYIFYRTYNVYSRQENFAEISASVIVGLYQALTIINLVILASYLFRFEVPSSEFLIPILLVLLAINWYRYEYDFSINKFSKWENEQAQLKKIRGWIMSLYLLVVALTPIVLGIIEHA